jgi:hypothetical protein
MKYILVWTDNRVRDMGAITLALRERTIEHRARLHEGRVICRYVQIIFANDLRDEMVIGRRFDEIFIMTDSYPDELNYKTYGGHIRHNDSLIEVIVDYVENEDFMQRLVMTKRLMMNSVYGSNAFRTNPFLTRGYGIKNVIFNDPATIVFWTDGTKTVVKAQDGDVFDPEKGLAMAISKKALGNKGNYCNELKKWLPKTYICMYCGADSYNPDWDHACDDCKDKPFEPIPESLKKDICSKIKLPDLSGLQIASMALDNVAKSLKDRRKKSAVQKAYDVLVKSRDGNLDCTTLLHPIEEAIGYLGEALED